MDDTLKRMYEESQAALPSSERVAETMDSMCLKQDKLFKCTSTLGHAGDHVACDVLGEVTHRWPNN